MRRPIALLVLLALLLASAAALAASRGDAAPGAAAAYLASQLVPLPRQTEACTEGVWSRAVSMEPRGRAFPHCIGDTVLEPTVPVLAYGRTWRKGAFTCISQTTALTCRNLAGHGWSLSRARSRIF